MCVGEGVGLIIYVTSQLMQYLCIQYVHYMSLDTFILRQRLGNYTELATKLSKTSAVFSREQYRIPSNYKTKKINSNLEMVSYLE